jgi:thiamine-monophosphate kinase
LIGEVEQGQGVRRSGARQGDIIWVTGYPGQAAAGLQLLLQRPGDPKLLGHPLVKSYNTPSHRALLGEMIGRSGLATAMIDTSDGFLGDLGHICTESNVGAELFQERLPVSEELRQAADGLNRNPYDFLLGESDDYELVITCRPENSPLLQGLITPCCPVPVTEVGRITAQPGEITLIQPDGQRRPIRPSGWDHFR